MASPAVLRTKPAPSSAYATVSTSTRVPRAARTALSTRLGWMFSTLPAGTWVLFDALLLCAGVHIGFRFFVIGRMPLDMHVPMWQGWATLATALVFAGLVFGLYERETLLSRSRILTRMMLTALAATVLTYAFIYAIMYTTFSRRVAGSAIGLLAIAGGSARLFACWALHREPRNLIIVGPSRLSNSLVQAFRGGLLSEYRLIGYVDDSEGVPTSLEGLTRLGATARLAEICEQHGVHDVVVGAEAGVDSSVTARVLSCLRRSCRVTNEATFFEKATGQIPVDEITPHWFLFADLQVHCERKRALKRAFDIVMAAVGLVVTLPALPIIALMIKLNDGGPVFYTQKRIGQAGQPFSLHKFRTMTVGAESTGSIWAVRNDPRVTRVGRLLRKTRIDELPQLYNVLVGQMSLVGPRPERPDFVVQLSDAIPYYNERHLVKPGLTGWAQIGFRYGASIEDSKRKLQFDLYYVKNMSIELDLMILLRTGGVFLRGAC